MPLNWLCFSIAVKIGFWREKALRYVRKRELKTPLWKDVSGESPFEGNSANPIYLNANVAPYPKALSLSPLNCSSPPAKCPAQELQRAEINSLPLTLTFETDVLAKFFFLTTRARRNNLQKVEEESPPVRQSAPDHDDTISK